MKTNLSRCAGKIKGALREDQINELAAETGFCRRLRKLTPMRAVWVFVTAMASGAANSLADILRVFCDLTGECMSYKPFHDRLSVPGFSEFMRQSLADHMTKLSEPILTTRSRYLRGFQDIVIQDGSSFALNPALKKKYPGRFTKISPAAVEVHCTYSLYEGQPIAIAIAPDKEAERHYLPEPDELAGKLMMGDRGYTCYEYATRVEEAGGHYLGRVRDKKFNPRLVRCHRGPFRGQKLEGCKLKDLKLPKSNVDLTIESKGCHYRLVLFYVKRKDLHVYLLTTLSHREFPPSIVAALYRLRWQVELFFKECKSYTNLKKFSTKDPHIVEGLIWASMLAILIRRFLLYSAFRNTGEYSAPFVAASISWTFFRDLAKVILKKTRELSMTLRDILELLRKTAGRTNPQRKNTFEIVDVQPVIGYA